MSALFRTLAAAPLALAVALLTAAPAQASTIYTYTGNLFTNVSLSGPTTPADLYTTNDRLTGFMEFAAPLAANLNPLTRVTPLAYSFSDGVNTITNATNTYWTFRVATDASGAIAAWQIEVGDNRSPGGLGGTQKAIATHNNGTNVFDVVGDVLCGPTVDPGCYIGVAPSYRQEGKNSNATGVWQRQTTPPPPVPEPTSLALVGVALAGLAARRRAR